VIRGDVRNLARVGGDPLGLPPRVLPWRTFVAAKTAKPAGGPRRRAARARRERDRPIGVLRNPVADDARDRVLLRAGSTVDALDLEQVEVRPRVRDSGECRLLLAAPGRNAFGRAR